MRLGSIWFTWLLFAVGLQAAFGGEAKVSQLESRAASLEKKGDARGALAIWQQAAKLNPNSALAEDKMGFLLAVMNRYDDAFDHFRRATVLDPKFGPAHYHLGVAYWAKHDPNLSLPELQAAVICDDENFEYRLYLGHALNAVSHFDEAASHLVAATGLNPASSEAWNQLGFSFQHNGDTKGALDAYARSVKLDASNIDALNNYGVMLVTNGRAQEAILQFRAILKLDPENSTARLNLGFAALQKGDLAEAATRFHEVIVRQPDSAVAHYDLGVTLKLKDDLGAAKEELRRAISIDPNLEEAHYTLGILYWQSGDSQGAANEMKAAISLNSKDADAHLILGSALKQQGDMEGAESALKSAALLDPSNPGPYNALGEVLKRMGDAAGSEEAFTRGAHALETKNRELGKMLQKIPR